MAEDAKSAPEEASKDEIYDALNRGIIVKNELISLDLKGIDITDFFRILSIKINKSIVPTKGVSGKATFYLNGLTLEDTLDVIGCNPCYPRPCVRKKRENYLYNDSC